jgi:cell division protein FtsN
VAASPVTPTPVTPAAVAGSGRYSVQLAAYDTRADAAAAVQRFTKRDIAARIDGEQKPFRVRVGYYATRAEAASALSRLKKLGITGFVAERAP